MKRRRFVLGASLVAIAAATALGVSSSAFAAEPQAPAPTKVDLTPQTTAKPFGALQFKGTTSFSKAGAKKPLNSPELLRLTLEAPSPKQTAKGPSAPPAYPTVGSLPISAAPPSVMARTGLTGYQQRFWGGYSLEPPDSELCAGNGDIVQTVNNVFGIYDQAGHLLAGPITAETFFSDQVSNLSDPKCYWDPDTGHFFVTELAFGIDGAFNITYSIIYIAVSQTNNPVGPWNVYALDVSDPAGNDCPCLADQPLIGADKWTFSISTNEFETDVFNGGGFDGAQMFVIDKTALALGLPSPNVVFIDFGAIAAPGCGTACFYSVQPAESPNANYDSHVGGFTVAMSAGDFFNTNDNVYYLWYLSNTSSISGLPNIGLGATAIGTGAYGLPPAAAQKAGDIPHGDFVGEGLPTIETNDDRMNEVEYNRKSGWIMGALNTGACVTNCAHFRSAILWNAVQWHWTGPASAVIVPKSGYIANLGNNVMFPASSTVNSGNGLWAYSLSGANRYPSSAYSPFTNGGKPSQIVISNAGKGPADGFTGYSPYGPPERWGDYSGAVTDGNKIFWSSEFIDQTCTFAEFFFDFTCGGERGFNLNWANSLDGVTVP